MCLLCQLPRVIIADAQSKRLCWPYKRTITYHIRGSGQDGATSANQLSVRTGGRDGADRDGRGAGERGRTADRTERGSVAGRDSLREPMTHDYLLSNHRPPPHPSHPRPSLGAGTALGKIPPLENFLPKSKPSTDLFNPRLPLIRSRLISTFARFFNKIPCFVRKRPHYFRQVYSVIWILAVSYPHPRLFFFWRTPYPLLLSEPRLKYFSLL